MTDPNRETALSHVARAEAACRAIVGHPREACGPACAFYDAELRETVDGFGIRTTWREGEAVLRQYGRDGETVLSYGSPTEARDAFEYVEARAHYGRF